MEFFEKFINEIYIDKFLNNIKGRKIIIWGASEAGRSLSEFLLKKNYTVDRFVDKKAYMMSFKFNGIEVESSEFLENSKDKYYVFVATDYHQEIEDFLIKNDYSEIQDYLYIFHKAITIEKDDEYVDIYGNKINGTKGTKINFIGYNSILNVDSGCSFGENVKIYGVNGRVEIGYNSLIQKNSNIFCINGDLSIKDKCLIGENSYIDCTDSSITFANECSVGKDIKIYCTNNSSLCLGERIVIREGCDIHCNNSSNLDIGKDCTFGYRNFLISDHFGKVIIGNDCMVSHLVTIVNNDGHPIFDIKTNTQLNIRRSIVIGNHVWLGNKCTIVSKSEIGDGSIVGANSLVNKKFSNNCIIVGAPAELKRKDIAWDRVETNPNLIDNKSYWNETKMI